MKTKVTYGIRRKRGSALGQFDYSTIEKAREGLRLKLENDPMRKNYPYMEPYLVKITTEPIK